MSRLTLAVLAQSFVVAASIFLSSSGHGLAEDAAAGAKKNKNFASCLLGANSCRLDSLSASDLAKVEAIWNLQKCRFGAPSCNKQALASDDLLKVEQAARTIADDVDRCESGQKPDKDRQTAAKKMEAALKELAAARREIESLKRRLAEVATAHREDQELARNAQERLAMLDQERARADAATKERDAARAEIESLKQRASEQAVRQADDAEIAKRAESAGQAFIHERARAEELAAELVVVRHEVETMKGRAVDPTCDAVPEKGRQAAAEREPAKPQELMTPQAQKARTEANISSAQQPATSPIPAATSPDEDRLLQRADILINRGDISAARAMLEHALDLGSLRAARRLAETYDPDVLTSWGVRGTRGDRRRAQELYRRAHEGGLAAPPTMLETSDQANVDGH
jgi:hypothetical protein